MADERPGLTGNANLTSHVNDPAMRRSPQNPAAAGGTSETSIQSDVSPLASAASTPAEENARRAADATAADQRARHKGLHPRREVDEWQAFEYDRKGR